jgi:CRISPR-associated protein Csc1
MYLSEGYLHNYALTYALGLTSGRYHDTVQVPTYGEDLAKVNEVGVYVTPAKPEKLETAAHTFKFADTRYHVKMEQSSDNVPGFGRIREITPESTFKAYVLSQSPLKLPHWIRLGKWLSKAYVTVQELELKEAKGAFTTPHPLNALDIPAETELHLYDLINMPPVSLIDNARLEGEHYVLLTQGKPFMHLPKNLRYSF